MMTLPIRFSEPEANHNIHTISRFLDSTPEEYHYHHYAVPEGAHPKVARAVVQRVARLDTGPVSWRVAKATLKIILG